MTQQTYQIRQHNMPDGSIIEQIEMLNPYGAIPKDINNCHYTNYLEWVAAGNVAPVISPKEEINVIS